MIRPRVIPCLTIQGGRLVKTVKFKDPVYIGDPVNAMRIFSEKEADEVVVLDIGASRFGLEPDYDLIAEIAGEAFMPMAYGGGVRSAMEVRKLVRVGVEKVVVGTASAESIECIREAAVIVGSQAIVACIDVKRARFSGFRVVVKSGTISTGLNLEDHVKSLVNAGAGEILINSVDRDGTMSGYDIELIRTVARCASVPVVACGGAGCREHLIDGIRLGGASAVCAGSMFVFRGRHRAVLINYPRGGGLDEAG